MNYLILKKTSLAVSCSKELTGGVKAGARAVQNAEQAAREGGQYMGEFVREKVVPGFATRVKASSGALPSITP